MRLLPYVTAVLSLASFSAAALLGWLARAIAREHEGSQLGSILLLAAIAVPLSASILFGSTMAVVSRSAFRRLRWAAAAARTGAR